MTTVNNEHQKIEYRGDDPAIKDALERIKPITLEDADWSADDRYGVIDGFIAVVDGRDDLDGALEQARELIQRPKFEVVTVIRQSASLEKTEKKIKDLFWDSTTFGYQDMKQPDQKSALAPARQGTILLDPHHDNFYIQSPSSPYSTLNTVRYKLGLEEPEYDFKKTGFLSGGPDLGKDFKTIFGAASRAFPEYISVHISNGDSTSEPGLMHFDSGYVMQDSDMGRTLESRDNNDLPRKFIAAANARKFDPLPGGVTITSSITGGGSIVQKTNTTRYDQYKKDERNEELTKNKIHFQDGEDSGYQGQDGDIMIMRNDRWPDDEHGNLRLPSDHCSTIINAHGNHGDHLGRIVGLMSLKVCYMSPQIHDNI